MEVKEFIKKNAIETALFDLKEKINELDSVEEFTQLNESTGMYELNLRINIMIQPLTEKEAEEFLIMRRMNKKKSDEL